MEPGDWLGRERKRVAREERSRESAHLVIPRLGPGGGGASKGGCKLLGRLCPSMDISANLRLLRCTLIWCPAASGGARAAGAN